MYSVTVCVDKFKSLLGNIKDCKMTLNDIGKIAESELIGTYEIRPNTNINIYCIMPNHFHCIVEITEQCRGVLHTPLPVNFDLHHRQSVQLFVEINLLLLLKSIEREKPLEINFGLEIITNTLSAMKKNSNQYITIYKTIPTAGNSTVEIRTANRTILNVISGRIFYNHVGAYCIRPGLH